MRPDHSESVAASQSESLSRQSRAAERAVEDLQDVNMELIKASTCRQSKIGHTHINQGAADAGGRICVYV